MAPLTGWSDFTYHRGTLKTREDVLARIRELRPWYHNVPLKDGISTKDLADPTNFFPGHDAPNPLWRSIKDLIPSRLSGLDALDVGCNAGFFSFKLQERGARVVGIDIDQGTPVSFLTQARFCAEVLAVEADFRNQNLLEMPDAPTFDWILFLGVFYHVPNFCDALAKLAALTRPRGYVVIESQTNPVSLTCYEGKGFRGDTSTFFVPSPTVLRVLLQEHGFKIKKEGRGAERHIFLCRRR